MLGPGPGPPGFMAITQNIVLMRSVGQPEGASCWRQAGAALIEHVSPEQHCLESLLFVIKTVFYAIFIITRFTSKVSQYDTIQNTILRL